MGSFFTSLLDKFSGLQDARILLLGLDGAGKTTILYRLRLGENIHSIPTVGFNVEHVVYKKIDMTMWDVGGQDKIRRLWKHYYTGTDAIIFVVDGEYAWRGVTPYRYVSSSPSMSVAALLVDTRSTAPRAARWSSCPYFP